MKEVIEVGLSPPADKPRIRVEINRGGKKKGGVLRQQSEGEAIAIDQVFHSKKVKVHETLSRVQECKKECEKKLFELQSLQGRVEIGFQPALDQMLLEEERLLADVQRRRMITEKLIMNEIEVRTAAVKQQAKLLQQQMISIEGCEEIVKHVLKLEPGYLVRAFPRMEIEAKQVLETFESIKEIEVPVVEAVTPRDYPKSYLEGLDICNKKNKKKGGKGGSAKGGVGVELDGGEEVAGEVDSMDGGGEVPHVGQHSHLLTPPPANQVHDERDQVIARLVSQVERLEALTEAKNEARIYASEQRSHTKEIKDLVSSGRKKLRKKQVEKVGVEGFGVSVALSGVGGGKAAARKFERDVREAGHMKSYQSPTMSNYAKGR
ncbi:hypothetical protein TrCOL_g12226 [Triparma columacea]|uniref:Uncharacterized protein n=1 Tax=Triparma columacea TaxID=722753 RepID=A0A9W7LAD4_9STRA|nr:hypothetical protein TrCOL_g12226 [Triparma columacea]